MRAGVVATGLLVLGCGRLGFAPDEDAGGAADAAAPPDAAGPRCDPAAPFGAPTPVAELDAPGVNDGSLRLLADELRGFFWSRRDGDTDVFAVSRADRSMPFTIAPVPELASPANDLDPAPTPDGLRLVLRSLRDGNEDLYLAIRGSVDDSFGPPTRIAELSTGASDSQAVWVPGTDELYFARMVVGADDYVWHTTFDGGAFAAPARVDDLHVDGSDDGDPLVTADRLTIYWRTTRPGGLGSFDIWTASRADVAAPFAGATPVPGLNSPAEDGPSWLSADGCVLYLTSDRDGDFAIYVATRGGP